MASVVLVDFPTSSANPQRVGEFVMSEAKYEHDMATIRFLDWNLDSTVVKSGSPVHITLRNSDESADFHGFVHHIANPRTPGQSFTEVVVIGASYVFKQASQRVYPNTTASDVVKRIAIRNNFSYDVADHPRFYNQISQAGHTDWELMCNLAKQCGYTFRANGTTLYFKPVDEDFLNLRESAKTFHMASTNERVGNTLYSFTPLIGDSIAYPDSQKSATAIGGVDLLTGQPFSITNMQAPSKTRSVQQPELFDRFAHNITVTDRDSAVYAAKATDELNKFPYRGRAILAGTPTLRPDLPVYFTGVSDVLDGYWVILSVEHIIKDFIFTTEVVVGTDSLGTSVPASDRQTILSPRRTFSRLTKPARAKNSYSLTPKLRTTSKATKPSKKFSVAKVKNRLTVSREPTQSSRWISNSSDLRNRVTYNSPKTAESLANLRRAGVR